MKLTKSFSFKEAYKFAATTFIDNFFTILKALLAFLGILIGALFVLTISYGLIGFLLGYLVTFSDIGRFFYLPVEMSLILFALPYLILLIGLYWITLEMLNFQMFRLAFSSYENKKPLTFSELFTFKNTPFSSFLRARFVLFAKSLSPLLVAAIPALGWYRWYTQIGGQESFQALPLYQQVLMWATLASIILAASLISVYIMFTYIFTGYSILEGKYASRQQDASYAARLSQSVKWRIFFAFFIVGFFIGNQSILYVFLYPITVLILAHIYKQLQPFISSEEQ